MDLRDLRVTDPSDFSTDNFRKLDSSLRCTICKDFYDGPVLLHCGHTFCSLCIRSVLPNKQECPVCRVAAKESHLVRNSVVGETVKAWSDVRGLALKLSNEFPSPHHSFNFNSKRKLSCSSPDPSKEAGPSRLSHNSRYTVSSHKETYDRTERPNKTRRVSIEEDIIPSSDPEEQELPNPASKNFPVPCPLCSRQVPYNSINPHLDSNCKKFVIDDDTAKSDSRAAWGSIFKGQAMKATAVSSAQDLVPTTRLAKVSYGLLTLGALRKLLAENGLPTSGDKDELIARHERWIAIYNANLDRAQPKTVSELKEYLKECEETGSRPGPKKVVDEKAWVQKNNAQFQSLIAAARPKPNTARGTPSPRKNDSGLTSSPLVVEKDTSGASSDVILID